MYDFIIFASGFMLGVILAHIAIYFAFERDGKHD